MKYKLLVLDIDGTLVGRESTISTIDRSAIQEANRRGIHIALCTGRAPQACLDILQQLSLDGCHAFFDGALVANPENGRTIYARNLDNDVVREAVKFARRNEMELELYTAKGYYAERECWSTRAHREFFEIEPTIMNFDGLVGSDLIIKGGLVATNDAEVTKADAFSAAFKQEFYFTRVRTPAYPGVDFINIVAPQVTKGVALTELAAHYQVGLDEIIAIGDGSNDVSLLTTAGFAVAMQESPAELKAVADYVTCGVEEGGVAAAVNRFLLH